MTWGTLGDSKYDALGEEINKQRDRGAAIIAFAVLEDHLVALIKSKLIRDSTIEKKVFRGYGPLGSFSARIDIGFLLGLYDKDLHRELHCIRKIRNEFAHDLSPLTFKSKKIRDLCRLLELPKGDSRRLHKIWDGMLAEAKTISGPRAQHLRFSCFFRSTNPRTQYIRSIQRITISFALTSTAIEGLRRQGQLSTWPEKSSRRLSLHLQTADQNRRKR